jgi:hypothetical protein
MNYKWCVAIYATSMLFPAVVFGSGWFGMEALILTVVLTRVLRNMHAALHS